MPATPSSPRQNSRPVTGFRFTGKTQISTPRPLSHPDFAPVLEYLGQKLHPLVSCTTAQISLDFPPTMLSYHLLTNTQLDDLAQYFHQTSPPVPETYMYPSPIQNPWVGIEAQRDVDLETKRRRFGHFIGLRGCDPPVAEQTSSLEPCQIDLGTMAPITVDESISNLIAPSMEGQSVWEMLLFMEREWYAALAQAQAEQYHSFGWK
ncbi:uncharacterized protein N7484_010603 [Penicillium longicatenatum]|uniref:uncharacterized protein n=1 Tax=Penicillium longicatenatum TaxID=1561947 RepID=UPI0025471961|nr:uncharacterized protein N7484_010603 [Penicillium longicatenatum]KAJ5630503.1 hypothetical protein N7484_010603 [Penicillium longicatenatum]